MYDNPYDSPESQSAAMSHSGLGIASFVTSLVAAFGSVVVVVAAALYVGDDPDALPDNDPSLVMVGLGGLGCIGLLLVSLTLGFAGLFQANRRKLFAVLGLVFSVGVITVLTGLFILGSME